MPNGYDPSAFPTSYSDPAYAAADQAASAAVGLPPGMLSAIRTKGEKSNADQISSASAATPYQITPATRQAIIAQTGVDPYLNPQTAAYGAAYLLKQSMDRNGGNPVAAVAEYHGGTDQANWGAKTMAYVKRVTGFTPTSYVPGQTPNPFQVQAAPDVGNAPGAIGSTPSPRTGGDPYQVMPAPDVGASPGSANSGPSRLQQIYQAYSSGKMSPEDAAAFEQDVQAGRIVLPTGSNVKAPPAPASGNEPSLMPVAPQQLVDAFNRGQMSPEDAAQFQKDIASNVIALPPGVSLNAPQPGAARTIGVSARGLLEGLGQGVGELIDRAKNVIDAPMNVVNAIANGQGPLTAIDQTLGTHLAPQTAAAPLAAVPNAAAALPSIEQSVDPIANKLGLPTAQTPGEQIVQQAARSAGLMMLPFPGASLKALPAIVAAGATGGAVGEQVHQATGSQALGLAANLLTTALSPMAASRVMKALTAEIGAREAAASAGAGAARVEPTMQAHAPETPAPQAAATTAGTESAPAAAQAPSVSPTAAAPAAEEAAAATPESATAAPAPAESPLNPAASPIASAARDFMQPDELAAQTRKAVGAGPVPFGLGKNTAREVLASQGAPDEETLAAAKRLGIEDNLQPDHLTSNQAYRELAQAIKSTPGSLARQEEMQGLQQVGERAAQIIEDAGGTRDLSGLSAQVKNQLMATQQQLDQKAEGLYSDLKQSVPAKTEAPANNVLQFIQQRADDLGGAQNLTATEKRILTKLTPTAQPMMINGQKVNPADIGMEPQFKQPTYALLDDVRKDIGNGLRNQGPFKDADTGLLKALYGRLAEDQRSALSTIPGALEKFDTARATVQMRKSVEDDLTSLFGKQLGDSVVGKLGSAISALPKGDESKFIELIKAVPPSMRQQVTASGLGYAFGKATKNGELNFKTYADWMDGLKKNSGAFNAVMGNLPPETRQQLLDLAKVSRGISNATRENITTGRIMAAREELNARADGLVSSVMNIARRAAVSHIGTAATAGAASVAGPIGAGISHALQSALARGKPDVMKAADELIVSPEFQALAKGGEVTPQAMKAAANSPTFRRFYGLAARAAANDPQAREHWLRGALNAAGQLVESKGNKNR
jgi:hypothetical protein